MDLGQIYNCGCLIDHNHDDIEGYNIVKNVDAREHFNCSLCGVNSGFKSPEKSFIKNSFCENLNGFVYKCSNCEKPILVMPFEKSDIKVFKEDFLQKK